MSKIVCASTLALGICWGGGSLLFALADAHAETPTLGTLRQFGAIGDGIIDDTVALQGALNSQVDMLDGEGRSYRVIGSLRVSRHLELRNATLLQGEASLSTSDTDRDSPVFQRKLTVRTIFVRPAADDTTRLRVVLKNLRIFLGYDESAGSRTDSAGIYIDHAEPTLEDVEIWGNTKGAGIFLVDGTNARLIRPYVHDITWKPYSWDSQRLVYEEVRTRWNQILLESYEPSPGTEPFKNDRIQEQLVGIMIVRSNGVTITAPRVERLRARFSSGAEYPYQTDGIDVASGNANVNITDATVSYVWEGFDLAGAPAEDIRVTRANIRDVHAFCFKVANATHQVDVSSVTATRCGLAAFVVSGRIAEANPPSGGDVWIRDSSASEVGRGPSGAVLWNGQGNIAGVRVLESPLDEGPLGVRVINVRVSGAPGVMQYGFLNGVPGSPRNAVSITDSYSQTVAGNSGFVAAPVPWPTIGSLHWEILGCEPRLESQKWWFLKALDSGWSFERMRADMIDLKNRGVYDSCR